MSVLPQLINGHTPEKQTILGVLKEIAYPDGDIWKLNKVGQNKEKAQLKLFENSNSVENLLPDLFTPLTQDEISHNAIIYRLAKLGLAAGFRVWVGKREQSSEFNGEKLSSLSILSFPVFDNIAPYTKEAIEQIDVIWFDNANSPQFGFEVEHSTTITSALERFVELLKINSSTAGKLVILAPSKRTKKLNKELTQSAFIGHPLYMDTKVRYVFYDDFIKMYDGLSRASYKKRDISDKLLAVLRKPMNNE